MIGGSSGGVDISKYLQNYNPSQWANQANNYLNTALNQGLQFSQKYSNAAIKQLQAYNQMGNKMMQQGYQTAQALDAPQHMATYNALDAYSGTLGLASPRSGSYNLATKLANQVAKPQKKPLLGGK